MMRTIFCTLFCACSPASLVDVAAGVYSGSSEIREFHEEQRRKQEHKVCIGGENWTGTWISCIRERPMTTAEVAALEIEQ